MNTYFYTTSTPDSGSSQLPGPGSRRSRQQCSLLHRTEIDGYSPHASPPGYSHTENVRKFADRSVR